MGNGASQVNVMLHEGEAPRLYLARERAALISNNLLTITLVQIYSLWCCTVRTMAPTFPREAQSTFYFCEQTPHPMSLERRATRRQADRRFFEAHHGGDEHDQSHQRSMLPIPIPFVPLACMQNTQHSFSPTLPTSGKFPVRAYATHRDLPSTMVRVCSSRGLRW